MKIIVTHSSPDLDGIISIWLIKKFLPGWENAELRFVSAGERFKDIAKKRIAYSSEEKKLNAKPYTLDAIETIGEDEVIHVDTGLGPLDHHQLDDTNVSSASLTFDFVKKIENEKLSSEGLEKAKLKEEAISRMVRLVVEMDHFKEVFWENPTADYHEFSLLGIQDGLKLQMPDSDEYYVEFLSKCLDALLHNFENRVWAETEIKENGVEFIAKWGKGVAIETINDSVLQLAQKMGYVIVVRKDPRKGYVRIKARPTYETQNSKLKTQKENIDLTLVYEKLKKIDPEATWFLHISKKMLLNGTIKNPKMRASKLSLDDIIKVIEKI